MGISIVLSGFKDPKIANIGQARKWWWGLQNFYTEELEGGTEEFV